MNKMDSRYMTAGWILFAIALAVLIYSFFFRPDSGGSTFWQ
jgi:hypothetical protein